MAKTDLQLELEKAERVRGSDRREVEYAPLKDRMAAMGQDESNASLKQPGLGMGIGRIAAGDGK